MDRLMDRDLQKKLRIRRKFRQIVRQVCKNLYWLLDSDAMELGENVRQNVTLIYSGKKKVVSFHKTTSIFKIYLIFSD